MALTALLGAVGYLVATLPGSTLSRADQIASVIGALIAVVGLILTVTLTRRAGPVAEPVSSGTEPASSGAAVATRAWKVPRRNRLFSGRESVLAELRARLSEGGSAVVQAVHGMGGVGKTQLAVEYAHRHAEEYDLVWWFPAERPELLGEEFLSLAVDAGLVDPNADVDTAVRRVRTHLRSHDRWLLMFDNAEDPAMLRPWLPDGAGHIVITSRNPHWEEVAGPVSIDVFRREESVGLLQARVPGLAADDADRLAEALGDLPLGLAQAAGMIRETGISAEEYETALTAKTSEVLGASPPPSYPTSLAAAVRLSVDQLADEDRRAVWMLYECAWLAPEPVPVSLLVSDGRPVLSVRRSAGRIARLGLCRVDRESGLQLHRLTQTILRERSGDGFRARAVNLLVAAGPENGADPAYWPTWGRLVPHILAVEPAESDNDGLRDLAARMIWYLLNRGQIAVAKQLAQQYLQSWTERYGPDDPAVLWAGNHLAEAHRYLGEYAEARPLYANVLARHRRLHGDDHAYTLTSANNLARIWHALGDLGAALGLHRETYQRRRDVLGEDHPHTLTSAHNLADVLRDMDDPAAAHELHNDTLQRRRRVLGENHLRTLRSQHAVAEDLRALGDLPAAYATHQDTYQRRLLVLGPDHPDSVESERVLAVLRKALGKPSVPCR